LSLQSVNKPDGHADIGEGEW